MSRATSHASHQIALSEVRVEQARDVRLGRVRLDDDRPETWCPVDTERQGRYPARFANRPRWALTVPGSLDMDDSLDVERFGVAQIVLRQVRRKHVVRIADELTVG